VQFAGKHAPLIAADFQQTPCQRGTFFHRLRKTVAELTDRLPDHGKVHRPEARQRGPVLAARHALQGGNDLLCRRQRMRNRERSEQRDRHRHQKSEVDVVEDVLPGQRDGGIRIGDGRDAARVGCARADRPDHRGVIPKQGVHGSREPARWNLADSLALAAERLLERAGGLDMDADTRRDQPHRFDGSPLRRGQQLLAHSAAAQHQLAPVQRFQRDRDTFGGSGGRAIDTAMGVDRRPDGGRAQAQDDDDKQPADKLKDEAHRSLPNVRNETTAPLIRAKCKRRGAAREIFPTNLGHMSLDAAVAR
jgi:hypothetical protein